jgi:hypothetical protein
MTANADVSETTLSCHLANDLPVSLRDPVWEGLGVSVPLCK